VWAAPQRAADAARLREVAEALPAFEDRLKALLAA
jgi:hypothetical protein